jgi:hypothetical protein
MRGPSGGESGRRTTRPGCGQPPERSRGRTWPLAARAARAGGRDGPPPWPPPAPRCRRAPSSTRQVLPPLVSALGDRGRKAPRSPPPEQQHALFVDPGFRSGGRREAPRRSPLLHEQDRPSAEAPGRRAPASGSQPGRSDPRWFPQRPPGLPVVCPTSIRNGKAARIPRSTGPVVSGVREPLRSAAGQEGRVSRSPGRARATPQSALVRGEVLRGTDAPDFTSVHREWRIGRCGTGLGSGAPEPRPRIRWWILGSRAWPAVGGWCSCCGGTYSSIRREDGFWSERKVSS